jgi:APA family basic amino acid/polyamine antiporter
VLGNEKPVAEALKVVGENSVAMLVAVGITVTMPTVLLVMQLGQIRILYTMSRDGLLGNRFNRIHSRFHTPSFATIAVGLFVGVLAATIDIGAAAELTNIGTLFAFVLVAIGVWILRIKQPGNPRKFKTPAFKWVCSLCIIFCITLMLALPHVTWLRFVLWMALGVGVYAVYGFRKSRLVAKE